MQLLAYELEKNGNKGKILTFDCLAFSVHVNFYAGDNRDF